MSLPCQSYQSSQLSFRSQIKIPTLKETTIDSAVDSRAYHPINLASVICDMFADHPDSLINAFCDDIKMFDYLYQYLPKQIVIDVLNNMPIENAVQIVRKKSCPHNIYDKVDPLLYVVRYFQDISDTKYDIVENMSNKIIKPFNNNIIPKKSKLNFVLECKTYLNNTNFLKLLDKMCNDDNSSKW